MKNTIYSALHTRSSICRWAHERSSTRFCRKTIMPCYDYRDLHCDVDFSAYQHIRVVYGHGRVGSGATGYPRLLRRSTRAISVMTQYGIRSYFCWYVICLNEDNRTNLERRFVVQNVVMIISTIPCNPHCGNCAELTTIPYNKIGRILIS